MHVAGAREDAVEFGESAIAVVVVGVGQLSRARKVLSPDPQ
jgi:hypothetical protein